GPPSRTLLTPPSMPCPSRTTWLCARFLPAPLDILVILSILCLVILSMLEARHGPNSARRYRHGTRDPASPLGARPGHAPADYRLVIPGGRPGPLHDRAKTAGAAPGQGLCDARPQSRGAPLLGGNRPGAIDKPPAAGRGRQTLRRLADSPLDEPGPGQAAEPARAG